MAEDIKKRRERQRRFDAKRKTHALAVFFRIPVGIEAAGLAAAVRSLVLTLEKLRNVETVGCGEDKKSLVHHVRKLDEMMGRSAERYAREEK